MMNLKVAVAAVLFALCFASGFTCSKSNPPEQPNTPAVESATPAVEATPADTNTAPPAGEGTEAGSATPAEGAPANQ